jgi:diguanylate cyclase (GGDEF)-like protein
MTEVAHRRRPVSFVRVGVFSIILLGAILGVYLMLRDSQERAAFTDVIGPVVDILASGCVLLAAIQSAARSKRLAFAWGAIAAAMLSYAIADSIWAILELVLKVSPFPSIADGFYLAYYPLFLAGVVLLPNTRASGRQAVKDVLDLGIILVAAILGFWNFLIGPLIQSNAAATPLEHAVLVAYPIGDLVLLGALLLIIYGDFGTERSPSVAVDRRQIRQAAQVVRQPVTLVSLLGAGLIAMIVADCVYGYQSLAGTYVSGGLVDLIWIAASLLIGLAGASQWTVVQAVNSGRRYEAGNVSWERPKGIKAYLPYAWLLGAFLLLTRGVLMPLPMSPIAITLGVGMILSLVVARQLMTIYDNDRLNHQLNFQAVTLENANQNLETEIAERQRAQEKLAFDALHDGMTGLANRALFLDHLAQAIQRAKRHREQSSAVLFMDLEQFKIVNDTLGHSIGDQVLISIGRRLKQALRSSDTVARFGGDEFAVLVEDVVDERSVQVLAEKLQKVVRVPLELQGRYVHVAASIGIVNDVLKYDRPDDLLRDADLAMYRAKALGTARSEFFRTEMRDQAFARMEVEQELRRGLEKREFRLYYQPITSLESDRIVGLEVLVRWMHPIRGLLLPADFLQVAIDSGLILPLGDWILDRACSEMKAWQDHFPYLKNVCINVNLSHKEFAQPNLVEKVAKALSDSGLKAASLRLEITEQVLVGNFEVANSVIAGLQHLGVQLQIDDFGTGYSSLAYIQRFPINGIKIDRSFVHQLGKDPKGLGLVRAIVSMGHELAIETIAEGIETLEQLNELKDLSCGFGQGFLLSRPLDAVSAEKVLAERAV